MEHIIIGVVIAAIFFLFASMKRGKSNMEKPSKIKSFTTEIPLEKALKIVIQFAQNGGYKVDDFDNNQGVIILSDSTTLTSYGYIYPIYFKEQSDSTILIEVGIKSKSTQLYGFDAPHERCFNGIKTAIFANYDNNKTNISNNSSKKSFLKPKFCPNCGKDLNQNDEMKFCDNCGEKL